MRAGGGSDVPEAAVGAGSAPVLVLPFGDGDAGRWTAFVQTHRDATLYHTLEWRDLVREVFGHTPVFLVSERQGALSGVLPLFRVRAPLLGSKLLSLPYDIGSGGPLVADEASEGALVGGAIKLAQEARDQYLEMRCGVRRPAMERLGLQHDAPVVISDLVLDDEAAAFARMHGSQRKAVRAAEKRGVVVREGHGLEDFEAFYRIYLRVFHAFGTPPYGPSYIRGVWKHLAPSGKAQVLLADVDGRCLAGMLLFCAGGTLINKLTMALPEADPVRAVAALYWKSIQLGLRLGYPRLSLGTAAPAQTGLLTFKERWGAEARPAAVYSLAVNGRVPSLERFYDSTALPRRLWRRLPLAVTPALGGLVNRWFC